MKYEMLYIIASKKSDEERKNLVEKVNALITKNGGSVTKCEEQGIKKYAYPIADTTDGYYVLANFEAPVEAPKAITSVLNITDGIVRYMCLEKK